MTFQEIENLSFADLKSRKSELLEQLASADSGELRQRYLQARTDAKQRDEKLSEQGKTIMLLQESHGHLKALFDDNKAALEASFAANKALAERFEALRADHEEVQRELADEQQKSARLRAEAERHYTALSAAQKSLNDAMNAKQLEAAERGE